MGDRPEGPFAFRLCPQTRAPSRAFDADLVVGRDDEASAPLVHGFGCEEHRHAGEERVATRLGESNQQQASMRTGRVLTDVREVEILCDEEAAGGLRGLPYVGVVATGQSLLTNGVDVVAEGLQFGDETLGQVLVELDVHRLTGDSATGKSSCAEVAANAIAARTSSSVNVGKSARISAVEHRAQCDACALEHRFAADDARVADDAVVVVHGLFHLSAERRCRAPVSPHGRQLPQVRLTSDSSWSYRAFTHGA